MTLSHFSLLKIKLIVTIATKKDTTPSLLTLQKIVLIIARPKATRKRLKAGLCFIHNKAIYRQEGSIGEKRFA